MMVILLLRDMKGEERAVPMSGEDLSLSLVIEEPSV